jgi:hypothetical protein
VEWKDREPSASYVGRNRRGHGSSSFDTPIDRSATSSGSSGMPCPSFSVCRPRGALALGVDEGHIVAQRIRRGLDALRHQLVTELLALHHRAQLRVHALENRLRGALGREQASPMANANARKPGLLGGERSMAVGIAP